MGFDQIFFQTCTASTNFVICSIISFYIKDEIVLKSRKNAESCREKQKNEAEYVEMWKKQNKTHYDKVKEMSPDSAKALAKAKVNTWQNPDVVMKFF